MQNLSADGKQLLAGAVGVLIGALLSWLKMPTEGMTLILAGVAAMSNALRSYGQHKEVTALKAQVQRSSMPPAEAFDAAPKTPATVPDQPAAKKPPPPRGPGMM